LVDDALQTLQLLANHHRRLCRAKVIGITGSNGKTTTKELIARVLEEHYNTIYTQGNLNNHIGVPLTLLTIDRSTEIAIVEMGANHVGEIAALCEIAEPDFGLITNIGYAHLEGFGSIDGVRKGKGELFTSIKSKGGTLFINTDVDFLESMAGDYSKVYRYSKSNNFVNETPLDIMEDDNHLVLSTIWEEESISTQLQLYGIYNIPNILAALNLGYYFEVSPKDGIKAIGSYIPSNSRSQKVKTERNTVYLDAYNANPTSMKHALKAFAEVKAHRKMVILGDMFELGEESASLHQEIAVLADELFGDVLLVGDNFSFTESKSPKYKTRTEVKAILEERSLDGYSIMLKGSRGMALEHLVDSL